MTGLFVDTRLGLSPWQQPIATATPYKVPNCCNAWTFEGLKEALA